ncbi:MAG: DUF6596 domain-containing protein [Myxococcota bacterium]
MSDDAFFRRARADVVATLVRRVGTDQLEAVEDAVQGAIETALRRWPEDGVPGDRRAWLHQVAKHRLLGALRQDGRRRRLLAADAARQPPAPPAEPRAAFPDEVTDDLLRMLFVCADPALAPSAQLVLALKVVVGFDVRAIAHRLFAREAAVYKRLSRARARLRESELDLDAGLEADALRARRPAVLHVLYVLFSEGHLSAHPDAAIRRELCDEALRLALLFACHPTLGGPDASALVALMLLHRARLDARQDAFGALLLLDEQDRSRVDEAKVARGLEWLAASAYGAAPSRYHAEAGIAAEHALAPSFAATRWDRIAAHYALLERIAPSPLHRVNRALALAEVEGPGAGLELLATLDAPVWLVGSHLWSAALADLHRRAGHPEQAAQHRARALADAPSDAVRSALLRRLGP